MIKLKTYFWQPFLAIDSLKTASYSHFIASFRLLICMKLFRLFVMKRSFNKSMLFNSFFSGSRVVVVVVVDQPPTQVANCFQLFY